MGDNTGESKQAPLPLGRAPTMGIRLATLLAATLALVLAPRAEGFVYWAHTDGGTIGRANPDGSGLTPDFIRVTFRPCGVAVDSNHVYWTDLDGATIGRANLDGTDVDPSWRSTRGFPGEVSAPCGVAIDGAHLYWTDFGGAIGRINLDGTGKHTTFITGAERPCGAAVTGEHIYWANQGNAVGEGNDTIGRANLDGTGVDQRFIGGADFPCGVALDAAHIYWAENGGDTIGRANRDGTDVNHRFISLTPFASPCGIAVDAAHVYWGSSGSGTVARANLDGTGVSEDFIAPVGLAPQGSTLCGVAVDALRSFSFGKAKRNKQKGTTKLKVKVPGPGGVQLAKTKGVKPRRKQAEAAGKVKLPIKPRGEAKNLLNRKGKAKVEAEVTYTPTGDDPTIVANTLTKMVKLVKRR